MLMDSDSRAAPYRRSFAGQRSRARYLVLYTLLCLTASAGVAVAQDSRPIPNLDGAVARVNVSAVIARQPEAQQRQRAIAMLRAIQASGHNPSKVEIFDLSRQAVVASYTVDELRRSAP